MNGEDFNRTKVNSILEDIAAKRISVDSTKFHKLVYNANLASFLSKQKTMRTILAFSVVTFLLALGFGYLNYQSLSPEINLQRGCTAEIESGKPGSSCTAVEKYKNDREKNDYSIFFFSISIVGPMALIFRRKHRSAISELNAEIARISKDQSPGNQESRRA